MSGARGPGRLSELWPLAGLIVLAAVLRFATLDQQSFWFDEAFTPTHVLHRSLSATLRGVAHTESTPPLYYLLAWGWSRVLGTGVLALRSLSALAGVATVPIAWAVGRALGGRRVAVILAALVAVNPLFVWYSQEARAYALFGLLIALSFFCFVRARQAGGGRALWGWAICSILALATHYFAVFVVGVEAAALVFWRFGLMPSSGPRSPAQASEPTGDTHRSALPGVAPPQGRRVWIAVGAVFLAGLALAPLVAAQTGHGTQWIGQWALSARLLAIPRYYLLGPSTAPLGNAILLGATLPLLAAIALTRRLAAEEVGAAVMSGAVGGLAILVALVLVGVGADYLAPRNLIGAMFPITAGLAVVLGLGAARRAGAIIALLICAVGLTMVIAVDASPRLQRGDWQGVSRALSGGQGQRAIVSPGLGTAPIEYYLGPLRRLRPGHSGSVSEIDVVGYAPLVPHPSRPRRADFRLVSQRSVHGLIVLRFQATRAISATERALRAWRITRVRTEVLIPPAVRQLRTAASGG